MALLGGIAGALFQDKGSSKIVYKGAVLVRKTNVLDVTNVGASVVDDTADLLGLGVTLQLISAKTGKKSNPANLEKWLFSGGLFATDDVKYTVKFSVDPDFGLPGAFSITNSHPSEFYLVSLTVEMPGGGKIVEFPCYSWVYNSNLYKTDRLFFSNQLYLPNETPTGLTNARKSDLKALQGDGTGIRQDWDRIYDYDTYNDLGNPLLNMKRPTLGGSTDLPYPRRCRTGRININGVETLTLTPLNKFYIPSDERFGSVKNSDFLADGLKALTHSVLPALESIITFDQTFDSLKEIKDLYDHGFDISELVTSPVRGMQTPLEFFNEFTADTGNTSYMKYPLPQILKVNEKGWMTDEEFARQMLCGVNPMMIQCLKEFPPMSTLDPEKYGPSKSAITEEHIGSQLEGSTVQQAVSDKKLFILSYHDEFMPYLDKINSQRSSYAYASRVLLFLKSDGTLRPVAIELSTPYSQRVFVPPAAGTTDWLWELAKAHAATNDSGYHQLVSHWLRTHACIEPFIIATHRQLSKLHPLNPFLQPHFKHTMSINSQARQSLINAAGIIELTFTPGKYCMEMSAVVYKGWRFDEQGLPADLIKRGMAVPDSTAKHGLKLAIEDYPYAADGLEIWDALEKWTSSYLDACYNDDEAVASDAELQAWWNEVIKKGHADKKDEPWWIKLDSKKNLALALTTIIWVASAHHAAVNFGQYAYAGYMPNHPTATHKAIPAENSDEHKKLLANPEKFFLESVSRKLEAILVMLTLEILSTHASDEEYLGQRAIANWTDNPKAKAAFQNFTAAMKNVEGIVARRNADPSLKNRLGPVHVAYTLLSPASEKGITGKGVPNSISI
ncbi:lipoxygenase [Selaginella moellendorffii]|uniref:Lipoxygenase n=1 Tax=Selaginella moellendorffii TaxID=88036 RepID=D8R2L2_SELML|nr:linoleate 9S-lipoxygenase [Selaginella moellendorffii]EFJ33747.1 lipoxygenase [Selaginella moellendorffii]|eukprot:XP_002964909.1 linoleate 9S-lipoxygenase [Selaginella moellendorffii]